MTRTFSTLGCADLAWEDILALAHRHALDRIELRAVDGTTDLPAWLAARFGSPAAWRAELDACGIAICAFGTSFRLLDGSVADRAALLAHMPWAEAGGVPWLRIFDGGKTGDATELANGAAVVAWWREIRRLNGWKTELMVETHDALITTPRLIAFFAAMPDIALLWDSHHTWKKGGEHPATTWRAVQNRTAHIHVKDSVSLPSSRHPFTYTLPGTGEFPMAALMTTLRETGYSGPLSLEWERLWHSYLPDLDTALTCARERSWW